MNVLIVDYDMGNIHSVVKKLQRLGIDPVVSSLAADIIKSDKLILPGVGHFEKAARQLLKLGLVEPLNEAVLGQRKPILGICLGMQLMTNRSDEGGGPGLGWIDAEVKKMEVRNTNRYKVPHIGWTSVNIKKESKLMRGINDGDEFYFVHSYYCQCRSSKDVLTSSEYDGWFTSAIEKDNIFGVQYHPEKSHEVGIQLIRNFISL